ncbi:MAG TPA: TonB-dependent receptor [Vicinamibacterales bacterium]|nr:TonB-dependent receptor [Vicinamibacterales bacterium]
MCKRPARVRWHRCLLGIGFIVAFAAAPAAAQLLYGGLVGTVTDANGAVVPAAKVTIVNTDTNLTRETTTDAQGAYSFANVLAGPYDVKVALEGFREVVRSKVPVATGQISRVDLSLQVGALTESITVQSNAELLQTDKADVHTELKSTEITNLPLNRFRNYQGLVVLVPGSLPPAFQNAETDTPQRSLNMTVNGQDGAANTTLTDGTRNVNVGLPHHNVYIPPAETIESVNFTTGSMDAEEGMAAGVAITVITKSGTNSFKGSAFEFFNNEKLNASPFYFGRAATPKLPIERQTFGGTLGGPIRRNQVFFFGSYEGYIGRQELFTFFNVPSAAIRNGDFSNALNANGTLQRIYDPLSGDQATGTGRVQFDNNIIPVGRMNALSRRLQDLYPLPNVEGTGAGGFTNNYRTTRHAFTDRHNYDAKVNWNRTSSHQLWGKYSHMNAVVDDLFNFPLGSSDDDGCDTKVHLITGGQTWSFGKSLLLDSAVGVSIMDQFCSSADFGLGMLGLDFGIPGTNDQGRGDPRYAGMPEFRTGFQALGNSPTWTPTYRDEGTTSISSNVTKVVSNHDFRFGYRLDYLHLDNWQPERANPRGRFDFAGNATRTFGTGSQTANFYNTYAAFMLGLVGTARKSYQYELFTGREWQHAMYLRDRWSVNQKITLDLGLRWEYYPIMTRADRQIEMLDRNTLDVLIGGVGGNPKNMGLEAPKDAFAPRLGGVYRLNDSTVLRSGYGVTFDARGMSAQEAFRGDFSYPLVLNALFQPVAGTNTFGWYGTLNQGIPLLTGPDLSTGRMHLPNDYGMQTAVPESTHRGRTHSWNVALERRVFYNVSVDVAYVGNKLVGGLPPGETQTININNVQHLGGGDTDRPYFPTFGRQGDIEIYSPWRRTSYHALQVGITRPFTQGFLVKGHYTFSQSKALRADYEVPDPAIQELNWALANGDRPHTFQMGFVYQLPWRSENSGGGIARMLINDWQLNGLFGAFSGSPFTVTADGTTLNTPGNLQTADLVKPVNKIGEIGSAGYYYDPTSWLQPEGVRFGTTTPNQFRGPGGWNLDLSVFRSFRLTGDHRIEFRAEASNVTNTPKFGNPTNSVNSGDFMRILSLYGSYAERQVRLAVRYSF